MPRASFFPAESNPQCPLCGWKPTQQVPGAGLWVVQFRTSDERTNILIKCDQCFCESVWKTWTNDNSFRKEVDV